VVGSAAALVLIVIIVVYRHDRVTEMGGVFAPREDLRLPIPQSADSRGVSSPVKPLKLVVIQSHPCSGNVKKVWHCASTPSFAVMTGRLKTESFF
jgi:hypothetical protein